MNLFSWFRRAGRARDADPHRPQHAPEADDRLADWGANPFTSLLEVAGRLVSTDEVRALDLAHRTHDGDSLRRELTRLLERSSRAFGPDHACTAIVLEQLARSGRNPAESASNFERCLAIRTRALGELHPDTVRAKHTLGFCFQTLGQYDRAIPLLEESLERIDAAGQSRYFWLPQVLSSLGISYRQTRQFEKAEHIQRRALELAEATAAQNPGNLVAALGNLGNLYAQLGRLDRAEECFSRGAAMLLSHAELEWKPLASLLHGLSGTLAGAGEADRAEAVYLQFARLCMAHTTIPLPRPWPSDSGGFLATALKAAGAPEDITKPVALSENVLASEISKLFGADSKAAGVRDDAEGTSKSAR
jgi:tetratricopeptide (TPR) repeat protein